MKKAILGLAFVAAVLVSCEDKNKKELENKVDSLEVKTEEVIETSEVRTQAAYRSVRTYRRSTIVSCSQIIVQE
jgi:hypothetical protein